MSDHDKLGTLVQRRDQESQKDILGIIHVLWGVMNILGIWIMLLVWYSALFWVFWIPAGIVLMSAIIYGKTKDLGRSLWNRQVVPRIWVASLVVLPLYIWVFPDVLHLYSYTWIFPVTSAWVALSMYATGVFNKQWAVTLGSLAFWVTAPIYLLLPDQAPWIFTSANVFGLILPGLVSSYGQRH
jgi:hypothetical protein